MGGRGHGEAQGQPAGVGRGAERDREQCLGHVREVMEPEYPHPQGPPSPPPPLSPPRCPPVNPADTGWSTRAGLLLQRPRLDSAAARRTPRMGRRQTPVLGGPTPQPPPQRKGGGNVGRSTQLSLLPPQHPAGPPHQHPRRHGGAAAHGRQPGRPAAAFHPAHVQRPHGSAHQPHAQRPRRCPRPPPPAVSRRSPGGTGWCQGDNTSGGDGEGVSWCLRGDFRGTVLTRWVAAHLPGTDAAGLLPGTLGGATNTWGVISTHRHQWGNAGHLCPVPCPSHPICPTWPGEMLK